MSIDESNEKKNSFKNSMQVERNTMMTYGKTKGILLLQKYLPKLNPFKSIRMVSSIEEWDKIKDDCPDRITCRTDTKIGDTKNVRIEGASGKKEDVPGIIQQIKNQNPNAVLLLMEDKVETIPRYKNDGGFNVAFDTNSMVIIELVGKGFDGRELTREKAVHERYVIPWEDVLFMRNKQDLQKSKTVSKYIVDEEEYKRSREERIDFLNSVEPNIEDIIKKEVPESYKSANDDVIKSILDDVILPLYKRKRELYQDNLKHFNIQGNVVNGKVVPWEIFRPERLISKSKELEK